MAMSGTAKTAVFFLLVAALGAGGWFWQSLQTQKRLLLENQKKELALKAKQADAAKAESERKAKETEARVAADARKKAEIEKETAAAKVEAARAEAENIKSRAEASRLAATQAEAAKTAADAEAARLVAEKESAVAKEKALAAQREVEALAAKKAADERARAEATLANTLAAKKIADAALAKSENERKTAEENAKAERDRKLRMYKRAATSRAEMIDLQRAERLLALDEAGLLTNGVAAAALENASAAMPTEDGATNGMDAVELDPEVAKIRQHGVPPPQEAPPSAAELELRAVNKTIDELRDADRQRRDADYRRMFTELIEQAEKDERPSAAAYYRRALESLVSESKQKKDAAQ